VFDIKNSRDFLGKLLDDFADFQRDQSSARVAINCAITAYHMHEWVWGDWLKTDYPTWARLGIRDKDSFLGWIDAHEPFFRIMQDITNGSKHFDHKVSQQTQVSGGFDSGAFDHAAFDTTRLEIEVEGPGGTKNWIEAIILIESVVRFWRDFFRDCGPSPELPASEHITEFK